MKLRQLSLLSLATSHATLTYDYLLSALDLLSVRTLEDLVISSIYAGLISAKLDPLAKRVDVSSVSSLRDLKPNSIPQIVAVLDDWNERCVSVLAEIEGQVQNIRAKAAERRKRELEHQATLDKLLSDENAKDRTKPAGKRAVGDTENGGGLDAEYGEAMDLDDNQGRVGQRNSKRGGRLGQFLGSGKRLGG